jgi:hypothetical protein
MDLWESTEWLFVAVIMFMIGRMLGSIVGSSVKQLKGRKKTE